MHKIVWTASALDNLEAIRDYLKQFNPYAAGAVAKEIIKTAKGLVNFPHRGRLVQGATMREAVTA